jgi:hypothetical protein
LAFRGVGQVGNKTGTMLGYSILTRKNRTVASGVIGKKEWNEFVRETHE